MTLARETVSPLRKHTPSDQATNPRGDSKNGCRHGGVPLGRERFARETGIKESADPGGEQLSARQSDLPCHCLVLRQHLPRWRVASTA